MIDTPRSGRAPVVRILLLFLGAALVAYAISDHPLYGGEPGFGGLQWLIALAGAALAGCAALPASAASGILLLAVTSLCMLGIAETAGEWLLGPRHRPIYQPDARLIFKFIPGRRSVMTHAPANGGETVLHRINSQGFRGAELAPAGGATRVAVYGDSFVHAFYTRDEETFVAQLGAAMAQRLGRPVEAVNAGVSSYGPDQVALKMEAELPVLKPALAVVAVFAGNDYGDLLRNKMFRVGAEGAALENRWTLDPKVRMWLELSQRESILKRAFRTSFGGRGEAGATGAQVGNREFLLAEAGREYKSFVLDKNDVVTNTHVDYYSADLSLTPDSESARYKVALMRAVLGRIRDVAAKAGVPLAFVFIPHPSDVAKGGWEWGPVDKAKYPRYDGRNQVAPLAAAAKELGVPHLDLFGVFEAQGAEALYFRAGDDHWNAAGQKLAAAALADHLAARGLPGGKN
jgi:hypothetical protein